MPNPTFDIQALKQPRVFKKRVDFVVHVSAHVSLELGYAGPVLCLLSRAFAPTMLDQNAISATNPSSGRKRPLDESNSDVGTSNVPVFGANQNIPFFFQPAHGTDRSPWSPPGNFAPERAFPLVPVVNDSEGSGSSHIARPRRAIALGGFRRFQKKRAQDKAPEDMNGTGVNTTSHSTTNHFTVNLPPVINKTDLPTILRGYLQFCFGFCLRALCLYLIARLVVALQLDVSERISESSLEINQEIAMCAHQYKSNLCDLNRIPAMIGQCNNWETCMNRNPAVVGRAKVGAGLLAEILNSFVEPISWKTAIFVLFSLAFVTVLPNLRTRRWDDPKVSADLHSLIPVLPPTDQHRVEINHETNNLTTRKPRLDRGITGRVA